MFSLVSVNSGLNGLLCVNNLAQLQVSIVADALLHVSRCVTLASLKAAELVVRRSAVISGPRPPDVTQPLTPACGTV